MSNGKTIIGAILVFIAAMHAVECASNIRPVSVFPRAAAEYHRYAAVLAATEPYRLQRADDVKRSLGVMKYLYHRVIGASTISSYVIPNLTKYLTAGSDLNNPSDPIRKNNYLVNSACAAYETKAGEIIR